MQLIHTEIPTDEYLLSLKSAFSSPLDFFNERFTGICFGNFFYVIHHCDHQWDRQYNSPKNAAIGHVSATKKGCDITFITFKGLFCPSQLFLLLFIFSLIPILACLASTVALTLYSMPHFWLILLAIALIFAGIESLFESMTERSYEGENQLLSLLYNPSNPY